MISVGSGCRALARDLLQPGSMTKLASFALAAVALTTTAAAAKTAPGGVITKQARKGDVASKYILKPDGALFRQVGANLCQITDKVDEFKIAGHPNDPSSIYLVRDGGNLQALTVTPAERTATGCPKAELQTLIPALDRAKDKWVYKIVDRKDTPLTLVAQSTDKRVTAWDDRGVAVYVDGAVDVSMNPCFGTKGKSFSSYVAFVLDGEGHVSKIGGKDPRDSKPDAQRYDSLDAFRSAQRVCK